MSEGEQPWADLITCIQSEQPIAHSLTMDEAAVDEQVFSHCRPIVYCWSITDEPLLPHLNGFMWSIAFAAVLIICLQFEYMEPGKSELICIPCTFDMLAS